MAPRRSAALLDKGRDRRNKGTRQKPALHASVYREWTDRKDTELELLVPASGGRWLGGAKRGTMASRGNRAIPTALAVVALAASVPAILTSARTAPQAAEVATPGTAGRPALPTSATSSCSGRSTSSGLDHAEPHLLEEATADYDGAIRLDPDDAAAYLGRCRAKSELGRHEEAIEDYDHAVRHDPSSASCDG